MMILRLRWQFYLEGETFLHFRCTVMRLKWQLIRRFSKPSEETGTAYTSGSFPSRIPLSNCLQKRAYYRRWDIPEQGAGVLLGTNWLYVEKRDSLFKCGKWFNKWLEFFKQSESQALFFPRNIRFHYTIFLESYTTLLIFPLITPYVLPNSSLGYIYIYTACTLPKQWLHLPRISSWMKQQLK